MATSHRCSPPWVVGYHGRMEWLMVMGGIALVLWMLAKGKPSQPGQPRLPAPQDDAREKIFGEALKDYACMAILDKLSRDPGASYEDIAEEVDSLINDEKGIDVAPEVISKMSKGMSSWYRFIASTALVRMVRNFEQLPDDPQVALKSAAEALLEVAESHNMVPKGYDAKAALAFYKLVGFYAGKFKKSGMSIDEWEADVVKKLERRSAAALRLFGRPEARGSLPEKA